MSTTSIPNTITKNINGEFKIIYGNPYIGDLSIYVIYVGITYLYSDPSETICLNLRSSTRTDIIEWIDRIISILSCSLEDLALHVNDPKGFDDLVYWRYSLVPNILSNLKCEVSVTL